MQASAPGVKMGQQVGKYLVEVIGLEGGIAHPSPFADVLVYNFPRQPGAEPIAKATIDIFDGYFL